MTKKEALDKITELQAYINNIEKNKIKNDKIFILSIAQYHKYSKYIPKYSNFWWLVDYSLNHIWEPAGIAEDSITRPAKNLCYFGGVRPAIKTEIEYSLGERIVLYDFPWIYLGDNIAIAEVPIGVSCFDNIGCSNYEFSTIREYLLKWMENR